ncbi:MAG: hypothetical protein WCS33_00305 [Candidatus Caldatribacteriota bacterium]
MIGQNTAEIMKLSQQLDFSIADTKERISLLYDLLMEYNKATKEWLPNLFLTEYFEKYYNPHIKQAQPQSHKLPVCYNLNYMAGYILFNKDQTNVNVIREKTQKYRDTKHVSLEQTMEEQGEESIKPAETSYLRARPTVTEQDVKDIPELQGYSDYIEAVKLLIDKEENEREKYKLRQILKEVRQDQLAAKLALQKPINFTRLTPTYSLINYYEDTGYGMDNYEYKQVSFNKIELSEPSHVSNLLKFYSDLRHHSYDDTQSDIRYILDTLDDLIEEAPLNEHFRYILIRRIDGETYENIAFELHKEMGLRLSAGYVSSIFLNRIPDIISKYYLDSFEEWYFTFKTKGDYKTCTKCKKNFLRSDKYFRKDKKSRDGLSTVCKECRKQQDVEAAKKRANRK